MTTAMCIIPQSHSFISHLLSLASYTPSLSDTIFLDSSSKVEMHLWIHLPAIFFYDEQLSHPDDIQLYTDAAPLASIGGSHCG